MMMRRVAIFLTMMVLIVFGGDAQNPDIPYVHYYDYLRGGLVIERADGTDSRLISDLIPAWHNAALAPEWSASGEWFVSATYERGNQPQTYYMQLQVVSSDGATRYDLGLSDEVRTASAWSPVGDVVAVMSQSDPAELTRFWLWDAATQTVLASIDVPAEADPQPSRWWISLSWSEDGTKVTALWGGSIVTLTLDGQTTYDDGVIIDIAPLPEQTEFVAPGGAATGYLTNPPEVKMVDGTVSTYFSHSYSTASMPTPVRYRWLEDGVGSWGFIDYDIVLAGGGETPIASVLFNRLYDFQRELPVSGEAGFLPEQAIPHLGAGDAQTALKAPVAAVKLIGQFGLVGWHPTDPNQLVTYSDASGVVFWTLTDGGLERTREVMISLPLLSDYPVGQVLHWLPDQDRLAVYTGGQMASFDLTTGSSEPLSDFAGTVLGMSDSGMTVLQDIQTGEQFPFDETLDTTAGDMGSGRAVLGGTYACCIQVFDVESGARIEQFYGTAYSLALSADGRWLATTSAGKLSIWALPSGA